jgi:hypothetical protein
MAHVLTSQRHMVELDSYGSIGMGIINPFSEIDG